MELGQAESAGESTGADQVQEIGRRQGQSGDTDDIRDVVIAQLSQALLQLQGICAQISANRSGEVPTQAEAPPIKTAASESPSTSSWDSSSSEEKKKGAVLCYAFVRDRCDRGSMFTSVKQ